MVVAREDVNFLMINANIHVTSAKILGQDVKLVRFFLIVLMKTTMVVMNGEIQHVVLLDVIKVNVRILLLQHQVLLVPLQDITVFPQVLVQVKMF
jgi:hypothetical protein